MTITFDSKNEIFKLDGFTTSYVMKLFPGGVLSHLYYGNYINDTNLGYLVRFKDRGFSGNPLEARGNRGYSLDTATQEYPGFGVGDYRTAAITVELPDGSTATDMRYKCHNIFKGKHSLAPLPSSSANEDDACTLKITLVDGTSGVEADLFYTVFKDSDVLTRNVVIRNAGNYTVYLSRIMSAALDFHHSDFHLITLNGRWACERQIERRPVHHGISLIESMRGNSSHQYNPFLAFVSPNADEENGEAYGFNLVYSGNFAAFCEVDPISQTRVLMGINPTDFKWCLMSGESFTAPEVVITYSSNGLGQMSRNFHRFYNKHLLRDINKRRPVLINSWEAAYFDFTTDSLLTLAKQASELGIEMLVVDDGWFGERNNDKCALGDWYVNEKKLKGGLSRLANEVNSMGMKLGLWIEPEMISKDSRLFEEHPEWCLQVNNRHMQESRSQLALDLSRQDVCDYLYDVISRVLKSANIEYIKWDINRSLSEVQSQLSEPNRQRETWHRNILGVYGLFERLRQTFPDILFEGCCGGGGRFDPGMMYFAPQHWTSDNTDPIERIKIQMGTSLTYPISAMASHVSSSPNHQTGRCTPLHTRGYVAFTGGFGYEMDLGKLTDEEKEIIKEQIKIYKSHEDLIRNGDFYRIKNPFEGNSAAWCFASAQKDRLFFTYVQILSIPNQPLYRVRISCADENKWYKDTKTGDIYSGLVLKHAGIAIPELLGDFLTYSCEFEEVFPNGIV